MLRRLGNAFRQFMYGRYGSDQLNMFVLCAAVVLSLSNTVLALIFRGSYIYTAVLSPLFYVLTIVLLVLYFFRSLSRNIAKRQQENRRFSNFFTRIKDRQHRYFRCPSCKQRVRVPKGKGKINIRCPKCGNRFVKRT